MKLKLIITSKQLPPEFELIRQSLELRFPLTEFKRGLLSPGDDLPAIAATTWGHARSFMFRWGYPDEKRKRDPLLESVWVETVEKKVTFMDGYLQRRCLIPVSGFQMDGKDEHGNTVRYEVLPAEDEAVYLAAVYRRRGGKPYAVLLTQAADEKYASCCKRMPFAVPRANCAVWVNRSRKIKTEWMNWKQNWVIRQVEE